MISADSVLKSALSSPSYAGPFAYDSQATHKTFMGHSPCVPLNTVVEALGGNLDLNTVQTPFMRSLMRDTTQTLKVQENMCSSTCSTRFTSCIVDAPGNNLNEKIQSNMSTCVQAAYECMKTCEQND